MRPHLKPGSLILLITNRHTHTHSTRTLVFTSFWKHGGLQEKGILTTLRPPTSTFAGRIFLKHRRLFSSEANWHPTQSPLHSSLIVSSFLTCNKLTNLCKCGTRIKEREGREEGELVCRGKKENVQKGGNEREKLYVVWVWASATSGRNAGKMWYFTPASQEVRNETGG